MCWCTGLVGVCNLEPDTLNAIYSLPYFFNIKRDPKTLELFLKTISGDVALISSLGDDFSDFTSAEITGENCFNLFTTLHT